MNTFNETKEQLISDVEAFISNAQDDFDKCDEIIEIYSKQHQRFRETAGNDDGNEDHPETYNEDSDDCQGCNRGEALCRLRDIPEKIENNIDSANSLFDKIEDCKSEEQLEEYQDKLKELEQSRDEIVATLDDVGYNRL